ncbi:MAG: rhomboid family intramembrane serine protease [Gammaproteobacteria bacterium]|nr:rhomboid family intramembrane serine protease [Gammaproteobacteria bacterium]
MLAGCVFAFLWQSALSAEAGQQLIQQYGLIPAWLTVFSSMFLYGQWPHLIGNLLYLWKFAARCCGRTKGPASRTDIRPQTAGMSSAPIDRRTIN